MSALCPSVSPVTATATAAAECLVHERGVFDLQHAQGQVGGRRLWHVALEGLWRHPQKISATFTFIYWSKTSFFGSNWHGALVNSSHLKCSSALTNISTCELVHLKLHCSV